MGTVPTTAMAMRTKNGTRDDRAVPGKQGIEQQDEEHGHGGCHTDAHRLQAHLVEGPEGPVVRRRRPAARWAVPIEAAPIHAPPSSLGIARSEPRHVAGQEFGRRGAEGVGAGIGDRETGCQRVGGGQPHAGRDDATAVARSVSSS